MLTLHSTSPLGRRAQLKTPHGEIQTPFFMPVGTAAAMRGITIPDLETLGAQVLLSNTYHLHLRPGEDRIKKAGHLHKFIGWEKPMLTDSGGFQVFSMRHRLKIKEHGVEFFSHLDGSKLFLGPKEAMEIQHKLGADMIMVFDECPPSTASRAVIQKAVDRTLKWAQECKKWHEKFTEEKVCAHRPMLFGIVQGGLERDLREKCAEELIAIGFDGYALGGLAVGESESEMYGVVEDIVHLLPEDAPRYLMGVGKIHQLKHCIAHGIDMFDCVLPMREARHGTIYLSNGENIRINNAGFLDDHSVLDPDSPSPLSRKHTKAYLSHLMRIGERYGEHIACMQNLGLTLKAMQDLRREMEQKS